MRIAAVQINPTIGDFAGNSAKIKAGIELARKGGADLVLFSELCLTGYPPEDFLLRKEFIRDGQKHLKDLIPLTSGITAVIGFPRLNPSEKEKELFNSAAIIQDGKLLGYYDKQLLPTYDVFDEKRYFEPGKQMPIWNIAGQKVAITICEDIWEHSELLKFTSYHCDPVEDLLPQHPDLLINLSASPYSEGRVKDRIAVCTKAAQTLKCPVVFCNQVGGNDSLIFDGYSLHIGDDGYLKGIAKGFEEDILWVDTTVKSPEIPQPDDTIGDLYKALVLGLRDYFHKSGFQKACLGLSGGIDSALVACIAAEALGSKNVLCVSLPSRYSSPSSTTDAEQLKNVLGLDYMTIPIEGPFTSFLELLEPLFGAREFDTTEENLQARIRGMIMMALSNKLGYIVLSTGNKSEMAMGYATLYGDMCGGLGVINDVTKMQVYALARWINRSKEIIPWNTIHKPPSAELKLNQKDSDSLPDYAIVDSVLKDYIELHLSPKEIAARRGFDLALVEELIRKIHRNEYKRRQAPPGLRVTEKAFSAGRRFPIVQKYT